MTSRASASPRKAQGRSDPELMGGLADGDLGPLGELYDRYHDDVRQFVIRASARHGDVDDVVHDTFLAATRAASSFDGRPSARPFLIGIAARLLRKRRRLWARWTEVLGAFVSTRVDAVAQTPEDDAGHAEKAARIQRALGRLTDEKRLVFLLVEREGMSGEEVARALDLPLGTVWTRLFHARADLRRDLKRRDA